LHTRLSFVLALGFAACSSSEFSSDPESDASASGGASGANSSGGAAGISGGGAGVAGGAGAAGASGSAGGAGDATDGGAEACTPRTFYLDGDGDGFGGTTKLEACHPPADGKWVEASGDCDDGNDKVNPGQDAFFSQGYVRTGSELVSFDYDCNGEEAEAGSNRRAGRCEVKLGGCAGAGYLPAQPARPGALNPYCGSTRWQDCTGTLCNSSERSADPIACH
jgi:hypothetical protein